MKRNVQISIVSAALLVLIGVYVFRSRRSKQVVVVEEEPIREVPSLLFFYADWCHYCDQFKPEWEKLEYMLGENPNIQLVRINGDERRDLMEQFQVPGFPTVILVTEAGPIPYEGERTSDGIMQFLHSLS